MLFDPLRPLLHETLREWDARPLGSFSPRLLFANGEQGGWWDPSDFSTMFQDSAGTTPVTTVGDPVGLIRDKSGRGNHRTQGTTASRPVLQRDASGFYYLAYDGVDDGMATVSVDFTGTDKVTVYCGINKQSDVAAAMFMELSASSGANNGDFYVFVPAAGSGYQWQSKGTVAAQATTVAFPAPASSVLTGIGNIGADTATLRVNGTQVATSATDQGTGTYGIFPLFFGQRAGTTLPFNGREYQTIIRGAASTAAQVAQAERFIGARMGIAL